MLAAARRSGGEKRKIAKLVRVGHDFKDENKFRAKLRGNTGDPSFLGCKVDQLPDGQFLPLKDPQTGKRKTYYASEPWVEQHFHSCDDTDPDGNPISIRYYDRRPVLPAGMIRCACGRAMPPQIFEHTAPTLRKVLTPRPRGWDLAGEILLFIRPGSPVSVAGIAKELQVRPKDVMKHAEYFASLYEPLLCIDHGMGMLYPAVEVEAKRIKLAEAYWERVYGQPQPEKPVRPKVKKLKPKGPRWVCADCREEAVHRAHGRSPSAVGIINIRNRRPKTKAQKEEEAAIEQQKLMNGQSLLPEDYASLRREIKNAESGRYVPHEN